MIAIGCDHAGYEYKMEVIKYLEARGIEYKDCGTYSTSSCDYPIYAFNTAMSVKTGECEKGIVICGTGIGVSIVANKVPGVRCALCSDVFSAKATRMHNDANMLAMGARVIGKGLMFEILGAFLDTEYEGGRHQKRIDMITEIEQKNK